MKIGSPPARDAGRTGAGAGRENPPSETRQPETTPILADHARLQLVFFRIVWQATPDDTYRQDIDQDRHDPSMPKALRGSIGDEGCEPRNSSAEPGSSGVAIPQQGPENARYWAAFGQSRIEAGAELSIVRIALPPFEMVRDLEENF